MRKALLAVVCLLCLSALSVAQDVPKAEVFGGYSYLRFNPGGGTSFNNNGWNASLTFNANKWLGFTGDFGGTYNSLAAGANSNLHTFLFGPKLTYRTDKFAPFVHALFGGARSGLTATGFGGGSNGSFSFATGGGVDYKVRDRISLRLVQLDYVNTRFANNVQNNLRFSTGLVVNLGKK